MRTRDDFGPCELTERTRVALGRWCSGDGRRLVVALAVMANTAASEPESLRSMARRAGVHHETAGQWAAEWLAIEARVREDADAELALAVHDAGRRLGRQAHERLLDEMAEAMPSREREHRPVVRLWGRASETMAMGA